MSGPESKIRGRFAPSPTGPLHFGSLIAALGSYLHAKAHGGQWLVRIDDLDPPREQAGASEAILRALECYGFEWDEPVLYQSTRSKAYQAALIQLMEAGLTYYCTCSRKHLTANAEKTQRGIRYPGTCRQNIEPVADSSIRIKTHNQTISFDDQHLGLISRRLESETGDFVIWRRDGLTAYQLAVVVDDHDQGITEVVRGRDLLYPTSLQVYLQQCLKLPTPQYLHLPLAISASGQKLSKQNLVEPLNDDNPAPILVKALDFLGQNPPEELSTLAVTDIMAWAKQHWSAARIPTTEQILYQGI